MNAFLSCLVAAVNKKKAGEDVCLVIDEALAALADKKFRWSEEIQPHAETIKKETESRGPSEPEGLVKMAKDAGVPLYANLGWAKILAIAESLPEGLETLELKDFLESLSKAKHVLCEHTQFYQAFATKDAKEAFISSPIQQLFLSFFCILRRFQCWGM